jgi:hypothetical protein
VLRHTSVQRAKSSCRIADDARLAVSQRLNHPMLNGRPMTMKSVRHCARRCLLDIVVAQASPFFSDHAPREVHLWQ